MNAAHWNTGRSLALLGLLALAPLSPYAEGRPPILGTSPSDGPRLLAAADDMRTPAQSSKEAATSGTHHVYSCDTVNHTWNDAVVPNQPGMPTTDVVEPFYRNGCPFGDPMAGPPRIVAAANAPSSGTHHVYSCDTVNHTWNDAIVPNETGGPTGDVVDPFYRNVCPFGSPMTGYLGTASTSGKPYVDSGNPRDSAHQFH